MEEIIHLYKPDEAYFWATHNDAEINLLLTKNRQTIGIECKRSETPKVTPSMRIAFDDSKLSKIFVIYPGNTSYPLSDEIRVIAFKDMLNIFSDYNNE